jgi:serine/threonine protein kinase
MNAENDEKTVLDDSTVLIVPEAEHVRICPVCGTSNGMGALIKRAYRCSHCKLELAHIDYAPNGGIRGIFGWLRPEGDAIANRYRIKSVLGKGGFGATYLVEDLRLNGKRRALKEVPELMFDEYETALLTRLNHPSIPDIIDRTVADGMVYLVLEFGGSRTLGSERKQQNGRIPQSKLIPWMRQLCEVLSYLHGQKPPIIHRDLKPDNILLDENERIMLIDFGIAKESNPAAMTRTLGRAATHGFSPPEQVMGTGTDERSDIYALGATFYALLTGQNPPPAHERVAGKVLQPPSQIVPEVSPELDAAIVRALSLNVNHRQQAVKEFADVLESIVSGVPSSPIVNAESAEPTVAVGQASRPTHTRQPSIRLPSGRITASGHSSAATGVRSTEHRPKVLLPLILIAALLAAFATGAYLFWLKPDTGTMEPSAPPVAKIPQPDQTPAPDQIPPQPPAAASVPTPQVPQTQTGPGQPVRQHWNEMPAAQMPPAVAPQSSPPPSGVSAQEMLKGRSVETAAEEPPSLPAPKPKPKPKPAVRTQSRAVERSPSKPAQEEPTWTIIPGGARRTD